MQDRRTGADAAEQRAGERWQLLEQFARLLEGPLVILGLVWLALLLLELTVGISGRLELVVYAIWAVFIVDFAVRLVIAPSRSRFLRANWLTAISLVLPALRVVRALQVFRFLRAARAVRSVSLLRVVTGLNRGLGALGRTMGRRGLGYVLVATAVVTVVGAAGMSYFEATDMAADPSRASPGLASYGDALWWTAMVMTTMGSESWPQTPEGRVLGWLLAVYAFAVFGYITASIASHFIRVDRTEDGPGPDRAADEDDPRMDALRLELRLVRGELAALRERLDRGVE